LGFVLFVLAGVAIIMYLIYLASGPRTTEPGSRYFAVDFEQYWQAAGRLLHGLSPYDPQLLSGPVASDVILYRYPPLLAFLLIPLSGLDYIAAGWIWVILSATALAGGLILALRAGGSNLSARHLVWLGAAVVWFLPTLDALWKGNLEGIQVLLIALTLAGGANSRAGAIIVQAWLKVSPVMLVPALLVRDPKRGLAWLLGGSIVLCLPIFILAPDSFRQLPAMIINSAGGGSALSYNLAPSSWLVLMTGSDALGTMARMATLLVAAVLVGLSAWSARRPAGWAAAILMGSVAGLLMPGTIWEHYLLILLPFGAYAWPRLGAKQKWLLFAGGTLISVGVLPGLAFAGATIFVLVVLAALWPSGETEPSVAPLVELAPTS